MNLYKQEILDHYRFPRHKGRLINPDIASGEYNPSCGDQVSFDIKLTNSHIGEIAFEGTGCVISQATASMLAEYMFGKTVDHVLAMTDADIFALLGIDLGPTRAKCALLSLLAVQQGLKNFVNKKDHAQ